MLETSKKKKLEYSQVQGPFKKWIMLPKANVSPPIYQDRKFRSIKTLKKNLKKDYDVINENKYVPFISERNGLGEIKNGYSPIKKDEKRRLLRKFNRERV